MMLARSSRAAMALVGATGTCSPEQYPSRSCFPLKKMIGAKKKRTTPSFIKPLISLKLPSLDMNILGLEPQRFETFTKEKPAASRNIHVASFERLK